MLIAYIKGVWSRFNEPKVPLSQFREVVNVARSLHEKYSELLELYGQALADMQDVIPKDRAIEIMTDAVKRATDAAANAVTSKLPEHLAEMVGEMNQYVGGTFASLERLSLEGLSAVDESTGLSQDEKERLRSILVQLHRNVAPSGPTCTSATLN